MARVDHTAHVFSRAKIAPITRASARMVTTQLMARTASPPPSAATTMADVVNTPRVCNWTSCSENALVTRASGAHSGITVLVRFEVFRQ